MKGNELRTEIYILTSNPFTSKEYPTYSKFSEKISVYCVVSTFSDLSIKIRMNLVIFKRFYNSITRLIFSFCKWCAKR